MNGRPGNGKGLKKILPGNVMDLSEFRKNPDLLKPVVHGILNFLFVGETETTVRSIDIQALELQRIPDVLLRRLMLILKRMVGRYIVLTAEGEGEHEHERIIWALREAVAAVAEKDSPVMALKGTDREIEADDIPPSAEPPTPLTKGELPGSGPQA